MIEVVAYDPSWIDHFGKLKNWYEPVCREFDLLSIEHVGSTSVPGLAAKPIIDIDIVVSRGTVPRAIQAFESHGHLCRGDLGITDRYAFSVVEPPFMTNTYVIVEDSVALRNHLTLRQVLRESPELRREYSVIKRQIAASTTDIRDYSWAKTGVIQKILTYGGMDDESLRLIRNQTE